MLQKLLIKPLGVILQEAGLVSASQIEVALHDQTLYHDLRLGEILSLRGWLKQETADFFAEHWSNLLRNQQKQPLGYYLKSAGLLDEEQISIILNEQQQISLRFGALAVLNGWLNQKTIDFFLDYLSTQKEPLYPISEIQHDWDESTINKHNKQILFIGEPQIIIPYNPSRKVYKEELDLTESFEYYQAS